MNGRLLGLLACFLSLLSSAPALGWGDLGHPIICEIAFQELDDAVRERALIQQDPEFSTFGQACTWRSDPSITLHARS